MNWPKWIVIGLCFLALFQYGYWGIDHCDVCKFKVGDFYDEYKEDCLKTIEYTQDGQINLTIAEPKTKLENITYKNETNS